MFKKAEEKRDLQLQEVLKDLQLQKVLLLRSREQLHEKQSPAKKEASGSQKSKKQR
eukprot:UN21495